jgi:hypothetical protein
VSTRVHSRTFRPFWLGLTTVAKDPFCTPVRPVGPADIRVSVSRQLESRCAEAPPEDIVGAAFRAKRQRAHGRRKRSQLVQRSTSALVRQPSLLRGIGPKTQDLVLRSSFPGHRRCRGGNHIRDWSSPSPNRVAAARTRPWADIRATA